jgi:biopolymer transport protein ExbD
MLISMTDVIFLLIIFLLIASNFASQTGLPVKLPGSVSHERQTLQTINITYYSDDKVFYGNEFVQLDKLREHLLRDYEGPEQVVKLSAEDNTALQKVINIMDIIRTCGYERIFVATQKKL